MTQLLQAESLRMTYFSGRGELSVLRGVSLTLAAGESLAIMGPSGSGKSTLLNILGTLEPPTAGRVWIEGRNPYELEERELARFRNLRIGFIFQDHHLLPQCSALENVLLPTLAGGDRRGAATRAVTLLDQIGLRDRADHRPSELSGGERQRVAIARALIHRPTLLLADEPTGNLDRSTAQDVASLLLKLQAEHGASLVCVTHSEELASRFGRIRTMGDGTLDEQPES